MVFVTVQFVCGPYTHDDEKGGRFEGTTLRIDELSFWIVLNALCHHNEAYDWDMIVIVDCDQRQTSVSLHRTHLIIQSSVTSTFFWAFQEWIHPSKCDQSNNFFYFYFHVYDFQQAFLLLENLIRLYAHAKEDLI